MNARPNDTHKSWVVMLRGKEMKLESSNWAPGYTPAHCSTQEAAVAYALGNLGREYAKLEVYRLQLNALAAGTAEGIVTGSDTGLNVEEFSALNLANDDFTSHPKPPEDPPEVRWAMDQI